MLTYRRTALAASLLMLSVILAAPSIRAQDKEKGAPKAGGALLTKNEELTDNDEKDTNSQTMNSPRKVYKITLAAGKSYQIDLSSQDFDCVLRLEDSAGKEVAFNDDYKAGSLDSRIVYTAAKAGEYKVIATCLDGKAGKFSLTVAEAQAGAAAGASMFKGKVASEITLKDGKAKIEAELTATDPMVRDHYYKIFTVKLEEGKTYRIEHRDNGNNNNFDAFLFLEGAGGIGLAQNDDFEPGKSLDSRIIHKATTTGIYRIICTTLPPRQIGKFILEVTPGTAGDEKAALLKELDDKRSAHFNALFGKYARSTPAEQKSIIGEVTKSLQDKGADLSIGDARAAMGLASVLGENDPELTKNTLKSLIKIFSAASNPQIAGVARSFKSTLTQLDMMGKSIVVTGKTVDGKNFDLKNLKGKVVLVDFWATWCGPCVAELPNMQAAYKKYHDKGFEVIGISLDQPDDTEKLAKFIEDRKLPWACINIEDSKTLADRFEVNSIPFPVLVDQAGNVVSIRARGPELDRLLAKLIDGQGK